MRPSTTGFTSSEQKSQVIIPLLALVSVLPAKMGSPKNSVSGAGFPNSVTVSVVEFPDSAAFSELPSSHSVGASPSQQ